jgi:phenylalanyl-tRNA synthetase alpha chain
VDARPGQTAQFGAMLDDIRRIEASAGERAAAPTTLAELGELERELLGKGSALVGFKRQLGSLDADGRREAGAALNHAQDAVRAAMAERRHLLAAAARRAQAEAERLDLTEVRAGRDAGHLHLVTQTIEELEDVFVGLGFTVAEGPEVEDDWHNFTALNFGPHHPARDMQDTFFVGLGKPREVVMRTHTSPVQVRVMEAQPPPIYSVMPGRVYRNEATDSTHLAVFHQLECLVIDRGITFGHLAGTIEMFVEAYFGSGWTSRLRPSYFPFTDPSAEFDIQRPDGTWLELGGSGMVHPNVLANCGIDPEEFSGFAFGFGLDRLAATKYGVTDLRELASTDIRFLEQF